MGENGCGQLASSGKPYRMLRLSSVPPYFLSNIGGDPEGRGALYLPCSLLLASLRACKPHLTVGFWVGQCHCGSQVLPLPGSLGFCFQSCGILRPTWSPEPEGHPVPPSTVRPSLHEHAQRYWPKRHESLPDMLPPKGSS